MKEQMELLVEGRPSFWTGKDNSSRPEDNL